MFADDHMDDFVLFHFSVISGVFFNSEELLVFHRVTKSWTQLSD